MTKRERDDPLLDHRRELVRHHRPAPLSGSEHLKAGALDLRLPAVIRRAVDPHQTAGLRHPDLPGKPEQLQAVAEQHVILTNNGSSRLVCAAENEPPSGPPRPGSRAGPSHIKPARPP